MVDTLKEETQAELQTEVALLRQRVAELERAKEMRMLHGMQPHACDSNQLLEALQALHTLEQNYRLLADNSTEMISRHRSDGTYIYVSPACHTLLGYTPEELIGYNCYDLFHPQDLPRIQRWKETILKSLTVYTINYRMRCKDGSYIWMETICKVLYAPHSNVVVEMIATSHNITQQKNAERKLARTHLMHQATIDSFSEGIIVFARNGSIINCNRRFLKLWNLSDDWTNISAPTERLSFLLKQVKDPKTFVRRTRELHESPEIERYDCIELKDGRIVECCGTPYWVGSRVTGQVWTFRDVTQRVSNERELRTSRARLKAIFDNVAVGIVMVNIQGHCIKFNDHWAVMIGYAPEEIQQARYLSFIYSYDVSPSHERLHELIQGQIDSFRLEARFQRKDGSVFWGDVSFRATRQDDSTIEAMIGIVSDITERKQSEETLRQTHHQLVQRVHDLEQRGREATLLNEMGDLLLSCQTVDEAYDVVAQAAAHLFAGYSGALYIFDDARTWLEIAIAWGNAPPNVHFIDPTICCALQQGWAYVSGSTRAVAGCANQEPYRSQGTTPFICVPLIGPGTRTFCPIGDDVDQLHHIEQHKEVGSDARTIMQATHSFCDECQGTPTPSFRRPWIDQSLGVLHLRHNVIHSYRDYERWERLAEMVARNIALALANLHLRAQLHQQSIRDPLTGLFNRRYLDEIVRQEINRASRHDYPVGIVMLDIDHFKQFNDTYGHEGGDVLLRALGTFLQQRVRNEDTVCRYGGEEFVIVLSDASLEDAQWRAQELCMHVRTLSVQHRDVVMGTITISLGVAVFPTHGTTGADLIRNADNALYRAKSLGRNRVVIADISS